MITARDLRYRYRSTSGEGIGPLSFQVPLQQSVAVLGASGSGKTTLLKVIAGIISPASTGELDGSLLLGDPVKKSDPPVVAFVFQDALLLPHMDTTNNVLLPFIEHEALRGSKVAEARSLLLALGLYDWRGSYPEQLSGGMKARVSLARALILRPDILFLDEAFSGLDIGTREIAYRTLELARSRDRTTILISTHDLDEAWRLADRILVLSRSGRLACDLHDFKNGTFQELRSAVLSGMNDAA